MNDIPIMNEESMIKAFQKHTKVWGAASISWIWLLICLSLKIRAEANDDIAIAIMIYRDLDHLSLFGHPAYTKFLGILFEWIPMINWWTVFSVCGITMAVFVYSYVLMSYLKGSKKWLAIVAVLILVYIAAGHELNFTRTAGVISLAGMMLAVECVCDRRRSLSKLLKGIGALLMMAWGSSGRVNSFYLCLPYCMGYFASKVFFVVFFQRRLCANGKYGENRQLYLL